MHKYDVIEIVNEGSYGIVMKCKEKSSGSIVAIKKFKECEYEDELVRKTGFREKSILEMVSQRNIIHLRDSFKRKGRLYLVFDYVSKNLLEMIEANPKGIHPELVRYYLFQLLNGVQYLHSNQIIHRDIKPENLLVDVTSNRLKLCDFGFARFVADGELFTEYVSTRWYRSPELILSGSYGPPADIFSVGCIMAEMLDGQPLFPGDTDLDQLCLIQRVCGALENEYIRKFYRNPRFRRDKFPLPRTTMSLEDRYGSMLDESGLNFLRELLIGDPKERLSAENSLKHPYFRDICLNPYYIRGNRRTSSRGSTSSPILPKIRRKKRNRQSSNKISNQRNSPVFPSLHPNIHPSLMHDHKLHKMSLMKGYKSSNNVGGGTNHGVRKSQKRRKKKRRKQKNRKNNNSNSNNSNNNNNSQNSNSSHHHKGNHQKKTQNLNHNHNHTKYNQLFHHNHPYNTSVNTTNLPQIRRLSVGSKLGKKKKGSHHRRSSNPLSDRNSYSRNYSPASNSGNWKFSVPPIRGSFNSGNGYHNKSPRSGRFYSPLTLTGRLKY